LIHAFSQNGETHSVFIPISDSVDNVKVLSNRIGALAAGGEAADCRVNSQVFKNDEKISSSDKCKNCHCKNGQVSALFVFMPVCLSICLFVCQFVYHSVCLSIYQVFKNDEKISSNDKCKNCHCKNGQVSVLFVFMSV
jgi:cytochrome c